MSNVTTLGLALAAGALLGGCFFGGLWWTVRKGVSSSQPALWFLGSSMLRTTVALVGFYVVSGGHWQRLLSCLLGFVLAKVLVTRLTRPRGAESRSSGKEAIGAPDSR